METFDEWVKARTAKCDMALKDASKFHFRKEISSRQAEGLTMSKTCTTGEIQPQPHTAKQPVDQQPQWPPATQGDPQTEERPPWSVKEERSPQNYYK